MGRTQSFAGLELVTPGAYSLLDVSRLLTPTSGGVGIVALIGESDGGKPGLHLFAGGSSPAVVKKELKSGPGANAARLALRSGSDPLVQAGASAVLFYKTNNSTPASLSVGATSGVAEVRQFTCVADVSGSLNNTYLNNLNSPTVSYYVWFNVNSLGVDPALSGKTGIMVALSTNDSANAVATATRAAIAAVGSSLVFATSGSGAQVIVTNLVVGAVTDLADGAVPTGFTGISTTTQGVDAVGPKVVLTTKQYGLFTNQYTGEFASSSGKTIVTIRDESGVPESSPAFGEKVYSSLSYSGNGSAATAKLWYVSSVLKLQTALTGQSDGSVNLDIDCTGLTLKQLQQQVASASSGYSFTIPAGLEQFKVSDLDLYLSSVSIKSPAKLDFEASLYELVVWARDQGLLVSAVRGSGNAGDQIPQTLAASLFSGGSRGTTSNSGVQAALNELLKLRVNILVPLFSSDNQDGSTVTVASCNAAVKDHVETRSSILGRSECQAYISISGNKDVFKAEAAARTSRWLAVTSQINSDLDIDGNLIDYPEWGFAVVCAQTQAGSPIGTPLTNRALPVSGLKQNVSWNPITDAVELIKAGCLIGGPDENNVNRIIAGYTSWLADSNNANIYIETVESLAIVAFNHRQFMKEKFVGVSRFTVQDVLTAIDSSINAEIATTGSIKGWDPKLTKILSATGGRLEYELALIPWEGIVFVLPTIIAIREAT